MTAVAVDKDRNKVIGEGTLYPARQDLPAAFSGVRVRSADSGEFVETSYVPRGSNRPY